MPLLSVMGKVLQGACALRFKTVLRKGETGSFLWHARFLYQIIEASESETLLFILLCSSFHSLVIDVTMALDTLSLPVLEPLSPSRLQDVTVLSLSCLYAGEEVHPTISSAAQTFWQP